MRKSARLAIKSRLRRFAVELEPLWQESRCPRCLGLATGGRFCRLHFQEAVATGSAVAIEDELRYLSSLMARVETYAKSFMWEHRGNDRAQDRAALLSAVGWCSGCRAWRASPPLALR